MSRPIRCGRILWMLGVTLVRISMMPAQDRQSLSVEEAIEHAVSASRTLQAARYDFALAVEQYSLGVRVFFPTLTINYANNDSVSFGGPDNRFRSLSLGVSQQLYNRGALLFQRRSTARNLAIQQDQLSIQEDTLARQVVQLYTEILRFRRKKEILERTKGIAQTQLSIAQEELSLGQLTRLELLELELRVADIDIQLQETHTEERRQTFQLARLLELSLPAVPDVEGWIREDYTTILQSVEVPHYVELAEQLQIQRRQATLSVMNAKENLRQTRLRWIPSISMDVELAASGESFPLTEPSASVSLSFAWDIPGLPTTVDVSTQRTLPDDRSRSFNTKTSPGNQIEGIQSRRQAELELLRQSVTLEEAEENYEFFVQNQLDTISQLGARRALLTRQKNLESEKRTVEEVLLEQGELRRIDFLENEVSRAQNDISYVDAVVNLFNTEIELLAETGVQNLARYHQSIIGTQP